MSNKLDNIDIGNPQKPEPVLRRRQSELATAAGTYWQNLYGEPLDWRISGYIKGLTLAETRRLVNLKHGLPVLLDLNDRWPGFIHWGRLGEIGLRKLRVANIIYYDILFHQVPAIGTTYLQTSEAYLHDLDYRASYRIFDPGIGSFNQSVTVDRLDWSWEFYLDNDKDSIQTLVAEFQVGDDIDKLKIWGWKSSSSDWTNRSNAYDDNTGTYVLGPATAPESWSSYLYLTIASVTSDRVRFYASASIPTLGISEIDIDVYRDGRWVDVYQGLYANEAWVEKTFTEGAVTKMRVRFYNSDDISAKWPWLYEADFWDGAWSSPTGSDSPCSNWSLIGDWGGDDAWDASKTFTDNDSIAHVLKLNRGVRGDTLAGIGIVSQMLGLARRCLVSVTLMQAQAANDYSTDHSLDQLLLKVTAEHNARELLRPNPVLTYIDGSFPPGRA